MDADIEFPKLVKIEEQEVPQFDVGAWLKDFMAKKQKEYNAKRKKKELLKGPTPLQRRKWYEQYLKNMKGYKHVQLKPSSKCIRKQRKKLNLSLLLVQKKMKNLLLR